MSKRYDYLDALREIAIIGVLLTHTQLYGTNHYPYSFQSILDHGTLGVQLFFIISAVLYLMNKSNFVDFVPFPLSLTGLLNSQDKN